MNLEKLGSFLKNKNIFFLVDACQSIGQVEINVKIYFVMHWCALEENI